MRAGRLKHYIEIQQSTPGATDAGGGPIQEWNEQSPFAAAWCEIQPLTGREQLLGNEQLSEATHRIRLRAVPGLTPAMRIKHQRGTDLEPRYFNILSVRDIEERGVEMELICRESAREWGA